MMASWVLYGLVVTGLFWMAAWLMEKALRPFGIPTRWGWAIAMIGSQVVALAALVRGPSATTPQEQALTPLGPEAPGALLQSIAHIPGPPALPPDFDPWVLGVWVALSLGAAITLLRIALRLSSLRASWRPQRVDGREVLISDRFGPAIVGLTRPVIVLPRWALEADAEERELMLRHEEEHLAGGDVYLLAAALLFAVAIPWNLLLWALGQRLRAAVEIDCDRRVLRRGPWIREYANLLLHVGSRSSTDRLGALTLSHPATFLEQRIRVMTDPSSPRFVRATVFSALSSLLIFGACEMNGPAITAPDPANSLEAPILDQETTGTPLSVQGLRARRGRDGFLTILGTAVNVDTGLPVGAVEVRIEALERGAITNTDGRFLLRDVPPGDHTVLLKHAELGETTARVVFALGPETDLQSVSSESTPEPLPTFPGLEQAGIVLGSVMESGTGAPIASARVSIPTLNIGALTNLQGRFLLLNVQAGTYSLRIEKEGFTPFETEVVVKVGETAEVNPAIRR